MFFDLTTANDAGTATSPENYLHMASIYTIATSPSQLTLAPQKNYDALETVYPRDWYRQFSSAFKHKTLLFVLPLQRNSFTQRRIVG